MLLLISEIQVNRKKNAKDDGAVKKIWVATKWALSLGPALEKDPIFQHDTDPKMESGILQCAPPALWSKTFGGKTSASSDFSPAPEASSSTTFLKAWHSCILQEVFSGPTIQARSS